MAILSPKYSLMWSRGWYLYHLPHLIRKYECFLGFFILGELQSFRAYWESAIVPAAHTELRGSQLYIFLGKMAIKIDSYTIKNVNKLKILLKLVKGLENKMLGTKFYTLFKTRWLPRIVSMRGSLIYFCRIQKHSLTNEDLQLRKKSKISDQNMLTLVYLYAPPFYDINFVINLQDTNTKQSPSHRSLVWDSVLNIVWLMLGIYWYSVFPELEDSQ